MTETIEITLKLENVPKQNKTPSKPFNEEWGYRSLTCMHTYLVWNKTPDKEYIIHQCARFQYDPRQPHTNTITRIGRYLIYARDKGLTFKSSNNFHTLNVI